MTEIELKAWAETRGDFDNRRYCGKDITVADVKAAVRQLFLDVRADVEEAATEVERVADRIDREHRAIARAADDVRMAQEGVRTCPPERYKRVEREATLAHYLDKLLDLLPSAAPPAVLPSEEP
jgi:hypothetical protein